MTHVADKQSVIDLLERTYHGDKAAIERFLDRPHQLFGGRTPMELLESGPGGIKKVVTLITRANSGFVV